MKRSSSLSGSSLTFQHPLDSICNIFRKPFNYLQDLSSITRIYQQHPRTISNIQYLPIPSSDLESSIHYQYLPRAITSATLSISNCHSVTFRVFLPLPGANSICIELSATISIFHYHSVTFRMFLLLP